MPRSETTSGGHPTSAPADAARGVPAPPDVAEAEDVQPPRRRWRPLLEWGAVAVGALLVALLIRAFLLQAFWIPSESMEPTLKRDDRILVNKLSYRFGNPSRGHLVVFEKPPAETATDVNDLIKRVIALEGETIHQQGDRIYIDGQVLDEPYLRAGQPPGQRIAWVPGCANPSSERDRCTIPEGHVWVMGDNRDRSQDSRFFGPIPERTIVGRAFFRIWPLGDLGFL